MKKAFSMMEIIFIIVIMGIIGSVVAFNGQIDEYDDVTFDKENLKQDLVYLKQLNINQDFFDSSDENWATKTDCINFESTNKSYTLTNTVRDILNPATMEQYTKNYKSIITINNGGANLDKICFDNMGRPFARATATPYSTSLALADISKEDIVITIQTPDSAYSETLVISKYTGFIR